MFIRRLQQNHQKMNLLSRLSKPNKCSNGGSKRNVIAGAILKNAQRH
jgi:hypothetical protein